MEQRTLSELKQELKREPAAGDENIKLTDIESDSRKIGQGSVFAAIKGRHVDGHDFMQQAFERGAACVLVTDRDYWVNHPQLMHNPKTLFVKGGHEGLAKLCSWFYRDPTSRMKLIGVTGTNGKSTVTHMLAALLASQHRKCAIFGTLGCGFLGNLAKTPNTTLDVIELNKRLYRAIEAGASYAALEVSSIGVCEHRIEGLNFRAAGFTNLTRDHLDYHNTMEAYFEAKKKFLTSVQPRFVAVNDNDPKAKELMMATPGCVLYGVSERPPAFADQRFVWAWGADFQKDGIRFNVTAARAEGTCFLPLLGRFNIENFMCALAILLSLNFPLKPLLDAAEDLKAVPGRMECFTKKGRPLVIVDYAHTPDGVESALKAAREHVPEGKIIAVLGCGGDRDAGKRSIMALKAGVYADHSIFTADNPRTEDPMSIIDDMLLGVKETDASYEVEVDRETAILKAYARASFQDCVLIAGKGHEDYQIFKDKTIEFSDRKIAADLMAGVYDDKLAAY